MASSYWTRRLGRHAALAALSAAMVAVVYVALPAGTFTVRKWNLATAYPALALLALSLLIGPWNVLRARPAPVSMDLRRDVGIWAGLLGLAHTIIGLKVHMQGKYWLYFVYPSNEPHALPIRLDKFGFANYTGLGSTLVLVLLLALSNDLALRRLGTGRWKALQRWNYWGFALMALHAVAYQVMEKRTLPAVVVLAGTLVVVAATQLAGFVRRRAEG